MTTPRIFIADIVAHASEVFGVTIADITGPRRLRQIVRARMACAYLAKRMTPLSYPLIGKALGGRDHSTIIHACERVPEFMRRDARYSAQVHAVWSGMLGDIAAGGMAGHARAEAAAARRLREQQDARRKREAELMAQAAQKAVDEAVTLTPAEKRRASRRIRRQVKAEEIVVRFASQATRPRNDFSAVAARDDAHEFHTGVAQGSADLLERLRAASPA